MLHKRYTNAT